MKFKFIKSGANDCVTNQSSAVGVLNVEWLEL